MNSPVICVVELGATASRAAVFEDGEIGQRTEVLTPRGKASAETALRETLETLVEDVRRQVGSIDAVSVSFSAFLDLRSKPGARDYGPLRDHEVVISAPHMNNILNLAFFAWVEELNWNVPVHIENDVNTALRAAVEHPTAVGINLGTGLAAGIKRNNRIVHSPHTWSCYQIGHGFRWPLPEELTRKCGCGSVGCLEAVIGAWALTDRYGVRPEDADDATYEAMATEVVDLLGPAIFDLVEKSGTTEVVLTGRAARGFDDRAGIAARLQAAVVELRGTGTVRIAVDSHGRDAGLIGAGLAALDYDIVGTGQAVDS